MRIVGCFVTMLALVLISNTASAQAPSVKVGTFGQQVRTFYTTEDGLTSNDMVSVEAKPGGVIASGVDQIKLQFRDGQWRGPKPVDERGRMLSDGDRGLKAALGQEPAVRDVAWGPGDQAAVAEATGLYYTEDGVKWQRLFPSDGDRSWAVEDARAVVFDAKGRLWFACPTGVGCRNEDGWTLYTGADGLPYDDFTSMAAAPDGSMWFGTHIGAIHFDGQHWAYRQGLRWLPDDDVRDVAVTSDGTAWFATANGVGAIETKPTTLAGKAKFYEDQIDKFHRRTEYEYVLEVSLDKPGDTSVVHKHDSDNDGLWTCMYGAGECFAYGATKDPKAKERATKVWRAMRFLGTVTQGGSNPAPPGYVARTVLPTGEWNPNAEHYTPEKDRQSQKGDAYWKVMDPRWPTSEDGKWYWKCDTSSDELDGHFFFYALYYDLVAETEAEKAPVREHVRAMADHFLEHDFCLVDHDGTPTRWAVYSPSAVNEDPNWFAERGLNSLSMLSYLAVAEHMTGDAKYREAADMLINEHHYAQNLLVPKLQNGAGSGNQSDDEMAFMGYYTLIKYEKDPELKSLYAFSLWRYWRLEEPEKCPLFNFIYAVGCLGLEYTDAFGTYGPSPDERAWLDDSVDTLRRFPLDRFNWRHTNSHRKDIVPLAGHVSTFDASARSQGYRVDGKVLPVDEMYFNHWNHGPWELNTGGNGQGLGDGAVFTLPYYMGLYHGFIED